MLSPVPEFSGTVPYEVSVSHRCMNIRQTSHIFERCS